MHLQANAHVVHTQAVPRLPLAPPPPVLNTAAGRPEGCQPEPVPPNKRPVQPETEVLGRPTYHVQPKPPTSNGSTTATTTATTSSSSTPKHNRTSRKSSRRAQAPQRPPLQQQQQQQRSNPEPEPAQAKLSWSLPLAAVQGADSILRLRSVCLQVRAMCLEREQDAAPVASRDQQQQQQQQRLQEQQRQPLHLQQQEPHQHHHHHHHHQRLTAWRKPAPKQQELKHGSPPNAFIVAVAAKLQELLRAEDPGADEGGFPSYASGSHASGISAARPPLNRHPASHRGACVYGWGCGRGWGWGWG